MVMTMPMVIMVIVVMDIWPWLLWFVLYDKLMSFLDEWEHLDAYDKLMS